VPAAGDLSEPARALVGPALDVVERYCAWLAGPGVERGLIGPRERPRLWERHILNCAVVAPLVPPGSRVDDVGSGAGLPGMVLALVRPDLEVTLVEPLLRRATFLTEVAADLGVGNVHVQRSRAEDLVREVAAGRRLPADAVTARAVAPMDRLGGWCLPLVRDGGELLALKGENASSEVDAARAALSAAGARSIEVLQVGIGVIDPPTTVVRVVAGPRSARVGRSPR
jgi:16S rRNA (guanine527-N7)-methyltransferase